MGDACKTVAMVVVVWGLVVVVVVGVMLVVMMMVVVVVSLVVMVAVVQKARLSYGDLVDPRRGTACRGVTLERLCAWPGFLRPDWS